MCKALSVARTRSGKQYEQARERCRRVYGDVCWLCGHTIPDDVPPKHPLSWSLDHVRPISVWPEGEWVLENHRPAHYGCNSGKRDRPARVMARTSRLW